MKPRDKVVTAEDIQSSLYFIHFEQPEDVNLIEPEPVEVPPLLEPRRVTPVQSSPVVQRKAVPASVFTPSARKPVSGTLMPVNNFDSRQNSAVGSQHMPASDFRQRASYEFTRNQRENQRMAELPRPPSEIPQRHGTSLTLIRRDPASGAQWNVARIEDLPTMELSLVNTYGSAAKRRQGTPMYIEILNPGYSKFLHTEEVGIPSLISRESDFPVHSRQPSVPNQTSNQGTWESRSNIMPDASTFRRWLWMEGAHQSSGGPGHRKNFSYDRTIARPDSQGSANGHTEKPVPGGFSQTGEAVLNRDDQGFNTMQIPERQSSFRGYVFMSPWSGRCEFVTGAGGGSLKVMDFLSDAIHSTNFAYSADMSFQDSRRQHPRPRLSVSYGLIFQVAREQ